MENKEYFDLLNERDRCRTRYDRAGYDACISKLEACRLSDSIPGNVSKGPGDKKGRT